MNGPKITVRNAKPADARQMNAYVRDIYATSEHLITLPSEFRTSAFRQRFWIAGKNANPYETCLLATEGTNTIGMLDSWTDRRARVSHVTTFSMSVHRNWRKQGIGTRLLSTFIDWVDQNPRLSKIELHVHADNSPAMRLYESLGFEIEGTRRGAVRYDNNRFVDDILMAYWPNSSNVEMDLKAKQWH